MDTLFKDPFKEFFFDVSPVSANTFPKSSLKKTLHTLSSPSSTFSPVKQNVMISPRSLQSRCNLKPWHHPILPFPFHSWQGRQRPCCNIVVHCDIWVSWCCQHRRFPNNVRRQRASWTASACRTLLAWVQQSGYRKLRRANPDTLYPFDPIQNNTPWNCDMCRNDSIPEWS